MTNGSGAPTPASGLPTIGGGGPPQGGPVALGAGQGGPGAPGAAPFGGPGGQGNLPVPSIQPPRGALSAPSDVTVPRKGSRFSISNWRVRWRLIAIIAVPTVTALVLGVIQIIGSVNNYSSYKRVQDLAQLNALVVQGAGALADERDTVAGFVAAGGQSGSAGSAAIKAKLTAETTTTTGLMNQISAAAGGIVNGSGYRSQTVLALSNGVLADITDLKYIRQAATSTKTPATSVIGDYDRAISDFITFSNDIAAGTGNATLQSDVSVLNLLLRVQDDASLQRAYLYQALASTPASLTPSALQSLNQASEQQQADTQSFDQAASVTEQQNYNNTVAGQAVDDAKSAEEVAVTTATTPGQALTIGQQQLCPAGESQASCWMSIQSGQINQMRDVSDALVGQITAQANSLESSSLHNAVIVSAATLLLLIIVLLITTFVARSMIRPLRKLRADALEVAGSKLPAMVRRLSESEGGDASAEIEPIGVNSTDEIGEVARAFDQVHREAVRLAADEAMLRGNLNAMFVNLSRRSQSLIERQLSLIDSLEQTEQDADRLSSLFRLDHLATRMRRNSENLLVLAGHEAASRRWSQPVPLVDVLRAAISEIEQYERVVLNVQPGIQVVGQAVNDVVHLVAEVVENATTFSPEETQVYVTGQPLTSGGVLLDITDNGVGISEQEMAHANWRLDNPPVVDVAVSRRMGLFVVGRLAARHGVRVRLRHAQSGGLTALIWLPELVAAPEAGQPLGRLRKFEADDYGPAPSLSAPTMTGAPGGPAATAARIPRLGGGGAPGSGNGNGNGNGHGGTGGFSAFGGPATAPAAPPVPPVPSLPSRPNGSNGSTGPNGIIVPGPTVEGPGAPLPVRQPGHHPLGPVTPAGPVTAFGGNGSFGDADGDFGDSGPGTGTFVDEPFGGTPFSDGDFAATRMPAVGGDGGSMGPGSAPFSPPSGPAVPLGNGNGAKQAQAQAQVTIPPSVGGTAEHRLPIFDSLESDWFRRSGKPLSSAAAAPAAGQTWNSPADEGWRAAQVVAAPEAAETTMAGLPKRVPRANLVPGSIGSSDTTEEAPPVRSADAIRSRMSSFQRGVRDARTSAPQNEEP